VRNKKKAVTSVEGLETFSVKLKDAAKVFGKKFAASSSVKEKDSGGQEIVIQGDVIWDLPALLEKEYKIPKSKIFEREKGGKLSKVR
jgi:density-regulated protein DRP1